MQKIDWSYLLPKDGPVVEGLEAEEVVYAANQPQYIPLRTLVGARRHEARVVSRWALTDYQRRLVAEGADLYLELMTFGEPLQPIRLAVNKGEPDPAQFKSEVLG